MSFNGSGTFVINSVGNPTVTGTTISSTWANALTADLATGLSTCVTKDGQTTTTVTVPFASGISGTTSVFNSVTPGTGGALLGTRLMRATADQSITSNTTLASATGFSFAIAASEEWIADFDLDIGAALSTTGLKIAVTVPASATLNLGVFVGSTSFYDTNGFYYKQTTTGGTATDFTTANLPTSQNALVRVSVWVLNSTNAGTVQVQIAQSTSSGTALTIRKGSHGRADRIA